MERGEWEQDSAQIRLHNGSAGFRNELCAKTRIKTPQTVLKNAVQLSHSTNMSAEGRTLSPRALKC